MNVGAWLLWGFAATVLLTTLMAAGQGLGYTRMSIPYMLGAAFTPHRERAKVAGFFVHLVNGWLFALVYIAAFHTLGRSGVVLGGLMGFVHAAFVLTVGMRLVPGMHPRMAVEEQGLSEKRQLEPPGFLALNYGRATPVWTTVAHLIYGLVLGGFYSVG